MSGTSPTRKFRSKTTEFLRGSSTLQSQVQGGDHSDHEQNHIAEPEHEPSAKKRGSRIPFIGRSRKKSIHSVGGGQDVQEGRLSNASRSLLDEQAGVLPRQPRASSSSPSLPQPTFGAKFAAFTSSKSKALLSYSKSAKRHSKTAGTETDYASDPRAPVRPTSSDSRGSRRRSRSLTPRPSHSQPVGQPPVQPTITVSSPTDPYNVDEFEGLFTKPRRKLKPNPLSNSRENPASPYHSDDAHLSSPTSDRHPAPQKVPRPGESPTSDSYPDLPSHESGSVFPTSISSAHRESPTALRRIQNLHGMERDLDSAEESEATSMLSVKSLPIASSMRSRKSSSSSTTITSISNEKRRSLSMLTSRLAPSAAEKRRVPAISLGYSQPPSKPLPSPPLKSPPLVPPTPPPRGPLPDLPTESYARPRAHTISSSLSGSLRASSVSGSPAESTTKSSSLRRHNTTASPSSPISRSSPDAASGRHSDSSSSSSSTPTLTKASSISPSPPLSPQSSVLFPTTPIADSDIDNASITELRKALRLRDTQIDEIISYVRQQTEYHKNEKKGLETRVLSAENDKKVMQAKIISLEKEAIRRDKEIKGLTWLVMNNRAPGGSAMNNPTAAIRTITLSARSAAGVGSEAMLMSRSSSTSISTSVTGTSDMGASDDSSVRSSVTSATSPSSSSVKLPIYRKIQIDAIESSNDSTAESSRGYLSTSTSGDGDADIASAPESSGPSQFSSSGLKPKRTMRRLKLVESVNSRTFSFNSSVPLLPSTSSSDSFQIPISIPDNVPYLLKPNKRASSSTSSNSSASPPMSPDPESTTFPTASTSKGPQPVRTLSSIPESHLGSSTGSDRPGTGTDRSKSTDKDREIKTFPFSSNSNTRTSTSSSSSSSSPSSSTSALPRISTKTLSKSSKTTTTVTTSSSSSTPQPQRLTPSEAYALNLKKGRPPSIAQVLDKGLPSGNGSSSNKKSESLMEESFGGRSRALLGLTGSGSAGKSVDSAGSGSSGKS